MTSKSYDCEHEAFAASRVSDYVYVPTRETFFSTLGIIIINIITIQLLLLSLSLYYYYIIITYLINYLFRSTC